MLSLRSPSDRRQLDALLDERLADALAAGARLHDEAELADVVHPAPLRLDGDEADDVGAVEGDDAPRRRRAGPAGDGDVVEQEAVEEALVPLGDAGGERCAGVAQVGGQRPVLHRRSVGRPGNPLRRVATRCVRSLRALNARR